MTIKPVSIQEIIDSEDRLHEIARNLRFIRQATIEFGATHVPVEFATFQIHSKWLETWSKRTAAIIDDILRDRGERGGNGRKPGKK